MTVPKPRTRAYRWHIAARVIIALQLGYLITNSVGVLVTLLWPGETINAVITMTTLSFVLYCLIVLWVFSVKSLGKLLGQLMLILLVTAGASVALYLWGDAP